MASSDFPPPPTNAIDWANVGFQVRDGKSKVVSSVKEQPGLTLIVV